MKLLSRTILVILGVLAAGLFEVQSAHALPAWARRYNADCSMCHTIVPQLNAAGHKFRRLGYRMPEEFDKGEISRDDLSKLSNYFAARARTRLSYSGANDHADRLTFEQKDVTLFYSGPATKNVAYFFEMPFEPDEGVKVEVAQLLLNFGDSDKFFFSRIGLFHQFSRVGFGGLDRPIGIGNPRVFDVRVNGFRPRHDNVGAEIGFSAGGFTGLVQATNGITAMGGAVENNKDPNNYKDYAVLLEYLIPDNDAASVSALFVNGRGPMPQNAAGTVVGTKDIKYNRLYLFTDYTIDSLGLRPILGGGVGLDNQFVTGLGAAAAAVTTTDTSRSYFAFLELDQKLSDTAYALARFDIDDVTNKAESAKTNARTWMGTGGFAFSFQENLKVTAEYTVTSNAFQSKDHKGTVEAQFNF